MKIIYDREFQLEKLVKKVSNVNDNKIAVIYGLNHIDAPKVMRDVIELSIDQKNLPDWTSISEASTFECTNDIKNLLLENVKPENLSNKAIEKRKRKWSLRQTLLTSYVKYRINEIDQIKLRMNEKNSGRSRNVFWPVLTTLSSFGLAMGIPLFSTLMFRQDQIINGAGANHSGALGLSFFIGMLSLAIILIAIAIIASVTSLINTIINNNREYTWKNIDNVYIKLIKRFFITQEEYDDETKSHWFHTIAKKWKFLIKSKYFFFYTDVDPTAENYEELLNLFKVLQLTKSIPIYSIINMPDFDPKKVTRNLLSEENSEIYLLNEYKNSVNIRTLINFIFYQVALIAGISSKKLIRDYPLFVNALYRFIDNSTTNKQLLDLCITLKTFIGSNSKVLIPSDNIDYFVDLFVISVLKGLEPVIFGRLLNDIINYGFPSKSVYENNIYKNLKVDELLNTNILKYKENSLLFIFQEFIDSSLNLKTLVYSKGFLNPGFPNQDEELEEIKTALSYRGYQTVKNDKEEIYDAKFASEYGDFVYLKFLYNEVLTNQKPIELFIHTLEEAKKANIKSIVLCVYGTRYFYQMIDYKYELISEIFS